jgi:hypothetical protein
MSSSFSIIVSSISLFTAVNMIPSNSPVCPGVIPSQVMVIPFSANLKTGSGQVPQTGLFSIKSALPEAKSFGSNVISGTHH